MSPITHGLLSWLVGNAAKLDRRGRIVVTIAGIAPDVDGLGYPFEALTRTSAEPLDWFHRFHHHVSHNALATVVIAAVAWASARRSWKVAGLALVAANLHLLCDLIGARGPAEPGHPQGDPWPIPYWQPFSDHGYAWAGQWPLASWQNAVITVVALVAAMAIATRRGASPVELVSTRVDAVVVQALRRRFASKSPGKPS